MEYLTFIIRNAARNRRRTVLTVLSVAVSLFLLVSLRTLLGELEGDSMTSSQSALRLITRHAISLEVPLPLAYKHRIARIDGVEWVSEYQWFPFQFEDPKNLLVAFAIDPAIAGRDPEYVWSDGAVEAFKAERTALVVPEKMMERFGWNVGDRITLIGSVLPFNVETMIVGTYAGPAQSAPFFHYAYFAELAARHMPQRGSRTTTLFTKVVRAEDVARVSGEIDAMFESSDAPTRTETEKGFMLSFTAMLGNVRLFLTFIAVAAVFAVSLVTANTMAMTVRERTTEIAILRTLGFRRSHILLLLTGESILISLSGALAGSLAAVALFRIVDIYHLTDGIIQHFDITAPTMALGFAVALLMATVSALVPSLRAANRPIASTLRQIV
ncbi:MAG TPA: FtsX-like permease family protein [Thermoanaerobaculia bacterium]|nr:FtsX-like permease family protein [Thermoanaerobaculia bacterium]